MVDNKAEKRKERLLLGLVVLLAFFLRIYDIGAPFLGNFAVRAAEYAMIAKKFLQGAPFYKPTTYLIVNGKVAYTFLEFPVFVYVTAFFNGFFDMSIEFWGRFLSIIYTCASIITLYLIVRKYFSGRIALISAAAFSVSPSILIYGRSFHAEPFVILAVLLSVYWYIRRLEGGSPLYYILSAAAFSMALLCRIQLAWYLVFLVWFIDRSRGNDRPVINTRILGYIFLGSLLPAAWYVYTFYAASIYPNVLCSIHHQINARLFPSPLLFGPGFYQTLFDYLVKFAFNPVGFFILIYGFIGKPARNREGLFYLWAALLFLTYFLVPQKIIDHNYYFSLVIPPLSVFFAIGLDRLLERGIFKGTYLERRWVLVVLLVFYLIASFRYSFNPAFRIPQEERYIPAVAEKVRDITEKNDRIVLAGGSTPLLYYCDRDGWGFSLASKGLDEYQSQKLTKTVDEQRLAKKADAAKDPVSWLDYLVAEEGADYFVCHGPGIALFRKEKKFYDHMMSNYKLVFEDKNCIIFKLEQEQGTGAI